MNSIKKVSMNYSLLLFEMLAFLLADLFSFLLICTFWQVVFKFHALCTLRESAFLQEEKKNTEVL